MGFKNSPLVVQRTMDRVLRPLRDFVRAYIDDLVAFSRTFDEHLCRLRQLFLPQLTGLPSSTSFPQNSKKQARANACIHT